MYTVAPTVLLCGFLFGAGWQGRKAYLNKSVLSAALGVLFLMMGLAMFQVLLGVMGGMF